MNTCRLAGESLTPAAFRSLACAQCLFYIYFVSPPYSNSYVFSLCPSGLLICDRHQPQQYCNCSQYSKVFNIGEFSINSDDVDAGHTLKGLNPIASKNELTNEP
ncbi:unnamed protein product [Toxocara canis]|uniref:Ovule protein n=1 Tax=Toxocara canis TaxID=6265 RepID=A0A183TWT5_TOXCA|nr:unnamed protein product [Toxocara canis]